MSRKREERRLQKRQRIITGVSFAALLMLCICIPGWAEYIVVDSPAGIYAEVS